MDFILIFILLNSFIFINSYTMKIPLIKFNKYKAFRQKNLLPNYFHLHIHTHYFDITEDNNLFS